MKKIFTILSVIALSIFASSCVHKGDLNLDPIPEIDFDLVKVDGYNYNLVNKTQGATNVSWSILSFNGSTPTEVLTGTGDTYNFTFPFIGSFWIKMTATYNGWEQTIYSTKFVDKEPLVKLDDDSFDDWNAVTADKFKMYGRNIRRPYDPDLKLYMIEGKLDYDSDNIYLYVVVDSNDGKYKMGLMPGGKSSNEFYIKINADGDMSTNSKDQGDEGYEWFVEFKFWDGEIDGGFVGTSDEYGGWDTLKESDAMMPAIKLGTTKEIDGKYYFEFALDRNMLGITSSAFGCNFYLGENWAECDWLTDIDMNEDMIFSLTQD